MLLKLGKKNIEEWWSAAKKSCIVKKSQINNSDNNV